MSVSSATRALFVPLFLSMCLVGALPFQGRAQDAKPGNYLEELGIVSASASTNDTGPLGTIPVLKGFNASLGTMSQHDSSSGWSSLLTPNVAYRFSPYFSMDAGVPVFMYINIDANVGTTAKPVYRYSPQKGVFGDTQLSFHLEAPGHPVNYYGTISMGMPSGNTDFGLGAGKVTYDINNHFEKTFWRFTPDIEFGEGDTSRLVDERVLKNYTSVGIITHFQAGTAVELPRNISFEADAYEILPLKPNLVFSTTGRGKKQVTTTTNVGPAEDNGFLTLLDIPLSPHVTLSGYYDRSLRDHDDVGGFSFTFLMRPPPRYVER